MFIVVKITQHLNQNSLPCLSTTLTFIKQKEPLGDLFRPETKIGKLEIWSGKQRSFLVRKSFVWVGSALQHELKILDDQKQSRFLFPGGYGHGDKFVLLFSEAFFYIY